MSSRKIITLLLFVFCINCFKTLSFDEFIQKFNKPYSEDSEQYSAKKIIFDQNVKQLKDSNCETCQITKFFDEPKTNFKKRTHLQIPKLANANQNLAFLNKITAPKQIDWRTKGIITSARDQGTCGCGAVFGTVALAESFLIRRKVANKNIDLSQQYLLTCTPNVSCDSGDIQDAIKMVAAKGLPLESKYPYSPQTLSPQICNKSQNTLITKKKPVSYYNITNDQIKKLLTKGPLLIGINTMDWQNYAPGAFVCSKSEGINHAVLLVGYTQDYWIVKNSWGNKFGNQGFIYLSNKPQDNCNVGISVHMFV